MRLHDLELSGNCYKVRLFAALAQIPIERVAVDFMGGEHQRLPFLELNPWGEIPVLVDGERVVRDSQAILVYLAAQYADEAWLPRDPAGLAEVVHWLSRAANEVQHGPNAARLVDKFGYCLDKAKALRRSARLLGLLDGHLAQRSWLACERPTVADCAVFPYVALAPEGGVAHEPYPHVRQWIERVKALPRFVSMQGI
ncbi:MAG TPA: glutathione S-transferase [Anaeromyxobacteraceae bacterium]|nr:glutathione S-transferase [Anaeromyxobacteraceae bacterium]